MKRKILSHIQSQVISNGTWERERENVNWKMRMKIGIEKGTKEPSDQERETVRHERDQKFYFYVMK